MTQIIGIAGVMGAGKTTLANALGKQLDATVVAWDDYDDISQAPEDDVEWFHQSRDYDAWKYPALAQTLKALKSDQSVVCPATNQTLEPSEFIIFDAPLGRRHLETGKFIDYLVWIEIPPDVSLSRWILRNYRNKEETKTSEILDEIEFYLNDSRPLFIDNDEIVTGADLIVNGMHPIDELTVEVVSHCLQR
jgi:uridine kinase